MIQWSPKRYGARSGKSPVRFADHLLDPNEPALYRNGERVATTHQALQLLIFLVENAGELVTRERLQEQIWPDRCVEFDQSLNSAVRLLRKALGDDPASPRFIATVPRRGYRFIAPVRTSRARWKPVATVAAALVVAIALLFQAYGLRGPERPVGIDRSMLAVLPFDDYSTQQATPFTDGLTEDLIATLAQLDPPRLGVIARTSSMQYRDSRLDAHEIGEALHVDYLLEGSARLEAGRVRVVAQLIRTDDASHVWAATYEDEFTNALDLQRSIAREVSRALELRLMPETANPSIPAIGSEAYLSYLQGRDAYHEGDIVRATMAYRRSLDTVPGFALAHHGLAQALIRYPGPVRETLDEARTALDTALGLDPHLADALVDRARIALYFERDWEAAMAALEQARALDPEDIRLLRVLGYHHVTRGEFTTGLALMQRAVALDPLSSGVAAEIGLFFMKAGDYERARQQCELALAMDANSRVAHRCLVHVHQIRGDKALAWTHGAEELRLRGVSEEILAALDELPPEQAMNGFWGELLALFQAHGQSRYVTPYWFAIFHAQRGEVDLAIDFLEQTLEDGGAPNLVFLDVDPRYRSLWGHPRFEQFRDHVMAPIRGDSGLRVVAQTSDRILD